MFAVVLIRNLVRLSIERNSEPHILCRKNTFLPTLDYSVQKNQTDELAYFNHK